MPKRQAHGKKSNWKWFAVPLLIECVVSGEPSVREREADGDDDHKLFEESIVLVRVQSLAQACKLAERRGVEANVDYLNDYEQTVEWKLIKVLKPFELFDDVIKPGTEIYSRFIIVSPGTTAQQVIKTYFPEVDEG